MDYLKLLEHSFNVEKSDDAYLERLEFLADFIFDFVTYENVVSSMMAKKCLEVCTVISNKETFEYIKNENNNLWYLVMVNMPFFEGKLEWGTSIRGAWWCLHGYEKFELRSCGLYDGQDQLLSISFGEEQWMSFIEAMNKFASGEA